MESKDSERIHNKMSDLFRQEELSEIEKMFICLSYGVTISAMLDMPKDAFKRVLDAMLEAYDKIEESKKQTIGSNE